MQLDGAVIVVTGGASGIGAGVVDHLVRHGARPVVWDREVTEGGVRVDVTDEHEVAAAATETLERHGRVDGLVGCAGVSPSARMVRRDGSAFPLGRYRLAIDVNLVGAFDVMRHLAVAMTANQPNADGERGVIVSLASIAAFEGQVGQAAYSASKGGLTAMTLPLARDLADHGIRVMTICPGTIDTPMVRALPEATLQPLIADQVFPKRLGTPEDIAQVVRTCFETPLLNGEVIRVDAAVRLAPR